MIERFGSGGHWESAVGYSRTVRAGDFVVVAGCTSPDPGDAEQQTRGALAAAARGLALAGAGMDEVIRTRLFLTDISQWELVGRVHAEVFGDARPVTTMVQVAALIDPAMVVEVEVEAFSPKRP